MDETAWNVGTTRVPVHVGDEVIYMEATILGGEEEVASRTLDFGVVTRSVGAIAGEVTKALQHARPDTVTVEIGCEIGVESGQLTAILVKGTAKANLKITLGWQRSADAPKADVATEGAAHVHRPT